MKVILFLSVFFLFSCATRPPGASVNETIKENMGLFKKCYSKYDDFTAEAEPSQGDLALVFSLDDTGKVIRAGVEDGSSVKEEVQRCSVDTLIGLRFPSGQPSKYRVNLKFSAD